MRSAISGRAAALVLISALALVVAGCGSDNVTASADQQSSEATASDSTTDTDAVEPELDDDRTDDQDDDSTGESDVEELFPDVIDATATIQSDGTWTFSATLSSPYDTPARYADGWRVIGADGTVFGTRVLTHDHQSEQPFTRSESGIEIPQDVAVVMVEGRDQVSGWGGATVEVLLER